MAKMLANPRGFLEMEICHDETQKGGNISDDTIMSQAVGAKQLTGTETFGENELSSPGYGPIDESRSSVKEATGGATESKES